MPPRTRRFSARLADLQIDSDVDMEQDDDIDVENDDEVDNDDEGEEADEEEEEEERDDIQSVTNCRYLIRLNSYVQYVRKTKMRKKNLYRHLGNPNRA